MERVYIEDENEEESLIKEGLQGDTEYQNNVEYPNLADVPERPDPSISIEEQNNILQELESNDQLQAVPSNPIKEKEVAEIEPSFNDVNEKSNKQRSFQNTNKSIRDVQIAKLKEINDFIPKNNKNADNYVTEEEEELHKLARELKNLETPEQINKVEDKIKKNDLYYTPDDIEKILGLKVSRNKKEEITPNDIEKKATQDLNKIESKNITETKVIQKTIEEREIPVARVTFNHGSSRLTDEDISKIKKVANLFYKNEGKKIVIVGHASSRTNYDMDLTKHALVNFNISLERARKVMRQFSTIGFDSTNIELVAMSDAKPLYAEIMPSLEAANRRAEIFIEY